MKKIISIFIIGTVANLTASGCAPIPVNTVPLHLRDKRPIVYETPPSKNGYYSFITFHPDGKKLAFYDSENQSIKILSVDNFVQTKEFKTKNSPVSMRFSPLGKFIVAETVLKSGYPFVSRQASTNYSKWEEKRVEIIDFNTGNISINTRCDAQFPFIGHYFSHDELEFSLLCGNGEQQNWEVPTWKRKNNTLLPSFFEKEGVISKTNQKENDQKIDPKSTYSKDDRYIAISYSKLDPGKEVKGFRDMKNIAIYDRNTSLYSIISPECQAVTIAENGFSNDGRKVAILCKENISSSVEIWRNEDEKTIPEKKFVFGYNAGLGTIRPEGVALSPDGKHVAIAILGMVEALLVHPLVLFAPPLGMTRSDLRVYSMDKDRELVAISIEKMLENGPDLAFSPDGSLLALADKTIRIYKTNDLIKKSE